MGWYYEEYQVAIFRVALNIFDTIRYLPWRGRSVDAEALIGYL